MASRSRTPSRRGQRLRCGLAAAGLAAALALGPARAMGQEREAEALTPAFDIGDWTDALRLRLGVHGVSEFDHGDAQVSWLRGAGRIAIQTPLRERWAGSLSFSVDYAAPDIDGDDDFLGLGPGPGPLLGDLVETTLRASVRRTLTERWALGAQGYLSSKFERGAEFGAGLRGGGVLGFEYTRADRFAVIAGLRIGSRLDHSGVSVVPYLRLRWDPTDRLRFRLTNSDARLELLLRERLRGFAFAAVRSDRYRLGERAGLQANAGSLAVSEASAGLGLRWQASKRVRWVGSAGVTFWQRLDLEDDHADDVARSSASDAAAFARLELERRF